MSRRVAAAAFGLTCFLICLLLRRNRRVPGLRQEVALLAGISIEYYTRLERGNARGVSEEVLDGLVRSACVPVCSACWTR